MSLFQSSSAVKTSQAPTVPGFPTGVPPVPLPPAPDAPPLLGGLVGYLSYDLVRRIERLPDTALDDLRMPDLRLLLARED